MRVFIVEKILNETEEMDIKGKCKNNPIIILRPCHRVVGKNDKPTGYSGGLKAKEFLLNLERENI